MDYTEAVSELTSQTSESGRKTSKQVKDVLDSFDKPQTDYKILLVGGTNGKGSTVEMISKMLQNLGYRTGSFTSPHLRKLTERVQVNSKEIDEEKLVAKYREVKEENDELSFFKFMTVIAYNYFSDQDVDYAVIEVGMGGNSDATNAVENDAAVITNIGNDHGEYLGDKKEEIAEEKSGIIPENGNLVTREDYSIIDEEADNKNCSIHRPAKIEVKGNCYKFQGQEFDLPVKGSFQKKNLENALKTVEVLEETPENIGEAISNLECKGRMDYVSEKPIYIHDGAHNPSAVRKIIGDLPENFTCVFGAVSSKDIKQMIDILEEKAGRFIFTSSSVEWMEEPEKIAEIASKSSEVVEESSQAVKKAFSYGDPVVATGSLYLIGELKNSELEVENQENS